MNIAGKCRPKEYLLREYYNKGYKNVELYLLREYWTIEPILFKYVKNQILIL